MTYKYSGDDSDLVNLAHKTKPAKTLLWMIFTALASILLTLGLLFTLKLIGINMFAVSSGGLDIIYPPVVFLEEGKPQPVTVLVSLRDSGESKDNLMELDFQAKGETDEVFPDQKINVKNDGNPSSISITVSKPGMIWLTVSGGKYYKKTIMVVYVEEPTATPIIIPTMVTTIATSEIPQGKPTDIPTLEISATSTISPTETPTLFIMPDCKYLTNRGTNSFFNDDGAKKGDIIFLAIPKGVCVDVIPGLKPDDKYAKVSIYVWVETKLINQNGDEISIPKEVSLNFDQEIPLDYKFKLTSVTLNDSTKFPVEIVDSKGEYSLIKVTGYYLQAAIEKKK